MIRPAFALRAGLAVAATFAVSVAIRWNSISYTGWFNPDEAELLAAGRRAAMQVWMPMATSSANTYLVLWPTSLGALDLLGVPMTLRIAHILSASAYAALISMVWVATARRWGWVRSAIFVVPAGYWMLALYPDFFQMGSEIPCMLLLVIGSVVAFSPGNAGSGRRLALVAALASLAPWFKVQSGLLAVALVVSACGFAYLNRDSVWTRAEWAQRILMLAVGGLAPTALVLGLMAVGGTLGLFWDEPVGFVHAYVTHNVRDLGFGLGETTAPLSTKVHELLPRLRDNAPAFSWALLGLAVVWPGRGGVARQTARTAVWATPILAALVTLLVLYPVYTHYLNFLFCGTAMAAIASAGLASPPGQKVDRRPFLLAHPLPAYAVLATMVLVVLPFEYQRAGLELPRPAHQDDASLTALCPRGSSVFVWGWAAELYAYYDWQPASRYVTYGLLQAKTPNQEHYRARFIKEMTDHPPRCVVNAVGPTWFGGITADSLLEREIPETGDWLERCYSPSSMELGQGGAADLITVWSRRPEC